MTWKRDELEIARWLGGERVPVTGRTRGWAPDVRHPTLAIEVKSRKNMPILIATAMDQALKAAEWSLRKGEGERLPIVVIHERGRHFRNAVVCMRLGDFVERFP